MLQPVRLGFLAVLSLLLIAIHLPSANTSPLEFSERDPHAGLESHGGIGPGKLGAVASESSICSGHGSDILKMGGNAADALVATEFCIGVIGMYHSGIGGGGFMLVRSPKGDYEFIDFRETAPAAAFEDMYKNNEGASIYGGLASGVPGEVRGLEHLHKKYGSLPWSTVVQPAIRTARDGFPVTEDLVRYMASAVGNGEDFLSKNPTWAIDFAPNGTRLGLGDTITRRRYADTLEAIAHRGADAFYSGPIAETMINAVQRENGTMTLEDLKNYTVAIRDISQIEYRGYKITSTSAPSSGSIALSILKILGTYKDFFSTEKSVNLSTHRLDEAMRFGYGERANFGDPLFVDGMAEYEKEILKQSTVDDIRSKISDVRTQNVSAYDPAGLESLDTPGTSHIAVADHTGLAISVITTINLLFGSQVMVPETGVIMNNEMNDFSIPGSSNSFGYIPSPSNYIRPGKRPLSSITPAIIERPNGKLFLIAGSAGGSRIITATVQSIIHSIDQGLSAAKALAKPRLHDQLVPNQVSFEYSYDNATVASMKARGHNVTWVAPGQSSAQLIRVLPNGTFDAAGEPRQLNSAGNTMARLSNVSVVVPLPSFDIDPLRSFDEDFFDRAVDNILSEEASIEESRDEMTDNNIGISNPFGYDGASDSSKLNVRRSGRTAAKSPHFSMPSTSSPTTTSAKKPNRVSSRIRKSMTMEDANVQGEAPVALENITQPQHTEQVIQVEPYPINEAGDHPSAVPKVTENPAMPTSDNEITAEEKIFVSVGPEKRLDVLKFVVSHSFMMDRAQPIQRSAREEFTGQVRGVAAEAGMSDTATDALVDHIRKTYLEDRGIVAADDAGSAFGDEVDCAEEAHSKSLHRKRRKSSSNQPEEKEHKKSKRRPSDNPRRHSHNSMQHDEPTTPASVSTEAQDNVYVEPKEPKHMDDMLDLPIMPTNIIRGSPSKPIDLTDSPPHDDFVLGADWVPFQTRSDDSIGGLKDFEESNKKDLTPHLSPNFPKEAIPESPLPEKVVEEKRPKRREPGKASQREKNRRKRERRRERNKHRMKLSGQKKGDSTDEAEKQPQGTSIDRANQARSPPSISQETPYESPIGSRRSSSQLPLPADPSLDEVQSKYFSGASKTKVGSKNKPATTSSLYDLSIPPKTLQLLKDLNLPLDFLSSDSSLSDAPSDFYSDWDHLDDPPSHIEIKLSPPKSTCIVPQSTDPEPQTPVKCISFVNPEPEPITTPHAKPLKHSPYFPRALVDAESCLPFPPIVAPSFGLIQEQLAHDPFRLLIATIFLNRTRGGVALPVLFKVFERYPTIEAMAEADLPELVSMINCLGFQNQRARKCITLAQTWLSDPPNKSKRYRKLHYPRKLDGRNVGREECIDEEDLRVAWEIAHLPGVGAYSLDSWRIFCRDELRGKASDWKGTDATEVGFVPEWKCVLPHDKELRAYLSWMWLKEGWIWDYSTGDLTLASDKMMKAAQSGGVAREEEGNWVLETSPVKVLNGLHESN
ncbi:Gamma-glutamyltranspeptidase [Penicillium italicum]|uniref:Glutathione hydrolase n=1 Tax=Penicillium italicum TaxID=40296 RepID=A0A0A2LCT8_PENIT|nr:Gamma-glutamyltranspeptidase [Penicillium italicum]